jgi:hypothetical protein
MRFVLLCGVFFVAVGCKSLTTGVKWEPRPDAPDLPARGDGCYVEVFELGREPERPYLVVGTLVLELSGDDLRSGGGQSVAKRFKEAACERGVFLVKDVKGYPNTVTGGVLYEAKAAVLLDENGQPILARSQQGAPEEGPPPEAEPASEAEGP